MCMGVKQGPNPLPDRGPGAPREAARRRGHRRSTRENEPPLIDNISTDELTPGWVCYYYDETLARYCLVGLRGGEVEQGRDQERRLRRHRQRHLEGLRLESRETAPYCELKAGVQLVIAKSIEKIYGQNCQNIGLLTSTDFGLVERIERGEEIPIERVHARASIRSAPSIVEHGGLFAYNRRASRARSRRRRSRRPRGR